MSKATQCPTCNGAGTIISTFGRNKGAEYECEACRGSGERSHATDGSPCWCDPAIESFAKQNDDDKIIGLVYLAESEKVMNPRNGWLDGKFDDPEFHRLYEREDAIEAFLDDVDREMLRQNLTRSELARRMECSPANVTQIMRRTTNLTAATMVDLALALNRRVAFLLRHNAAVQ